MPLGTRSPDTFTIDAFLLGFSKFEFEQLLNDGSYGPVVDLGILNSEELTKEISLLEMEDGSGGTATTALELVSKLKPAWELGLFNFSANLAQYLFGAPSLTTNVADAAKNVPAELLQIPTSETDAARTFINLSNADVDDTPGNLTLTCAEVTEVILGDGTGDTPGDFSLKFKPLLFGDVTAATETNTATGVLVRTYTMVDTTSGGATELGVQDGVIATSGDLDLSQVVPVGNQLNITYTPTHVLEEDIDALDPDMMLDPLLGRIRFPNIDTPLAKDATSPLRAGQPLSLSYNYNQKASVTFKPFTQGGGSFLGRCTVRHWTDVGSNFTWVIPSVTIRIDDQALSFGTEDFVNGSLVIGINDAGGTDRFGTFTLANQNQAAA